MIAFLSGLVFAIGLGISGMTDPAKVKSFLDVTGAWDPSLAFVMVGAIAVHVVFAQIARRRAKPMFAEAFLLPVKTRIDARLVGGSALFGFGWGAAGFCPGPALVVLVGLSPAAVVFVAAMLLGIALVEWAPRLNGRRFSR